MTVTRTNAAQRARQLGVLALLAITSLAGQERGSQDPRQAERGKYFGKKSYSPAPLPVFAEMQSRLPSPIYDENPLFLKLYWKAWEIAFKNFHEPAPASGFVSQFIDAAFNDNIFLWDTAFMTMFCNVAAPLVPGIGSLDNFYAKQHPTGEICREIQRKSGLDFSSWVNSDDTTLFTRWGWDFPPARQLQVRYVGRGIPKPNPRLTLDALDHPILAWAELESYAVTGDSSRLRRVWDPLVHYYQAFRTYLLQGNGLYITDWASMDNSPRNADLLDGGTGVDISSEMVLFARNLSSIARILGKNSESRSFAREADDLSRRINKLMWNSKQGFYFDLKIDGSASSVKTVAAYWTLLSRVASPAQARLLVDHLKNPKTFGRFHPVPTCAADEQGYLSSGGYWRGAVWAPTNTMVIRGLENYGYADLARSIAQQHLQIMAKVFEQTGTIWENYAPDSENPGRNTDSSLVNKDFVGWSGIGPILYFLEYGIGLKPDATANKLTWRIQSTQRVGCERYRFNGHVVTLVAEPSGAGAINISVNSDGLFTLLAEHHGVRKQFAVHHGANRFAIP
ncbi:MAG TPA: alpha,alpha-trehalase [Bacteroidetes bacterium]|nr:alpha,alpha-trehalase [Bacteroidota bacterium]